MRTATDGLRFKSELLLGLDELQWSQGMLDDLARARRVALTRQAGIIVPHFGGLEGLSNLWGVSLDSDGVLSVQVQDVANGISFNKAMLVDVDGYAVVATPDAESNYIETSVSVNDDGEWYTVQVRRAATTKDKGLLTFSSGSPTVTGVGTEFTRYAGYTGDDFDRGTLIHIDAGDSASLAGDYEIDEVVDDNEITLRTNAPASASAVPFSVQGRFYSTVPTDGVIHQRSELEFRVVAVTRGPPTDGWVNLADVRKMPSGTPTHYIIDRRVESLWRPVQSFGRSATVIPAVTSGRIVRTVGIEGGIDFRTYDTTPGDGTLGTYTYGPTGTTDQVFIVKPVSLPHGALLGRLLVNWYQAASGALGAAKLRAYTRGASSFTDIMELSYTTTGSVGYASSTTSTIDAGFEYVDTETYWYAIYVSMDNNSSGGTAMGVQSARIEYTEHEQLQLQADRVDRGAVDSTLGARGMPSLIRDARNNLVVAYDSGSQLVLRRAYGDAGVGADPAASDTTWPWSLYDGSWWGPPGADPTVIDSDTSSTDPVLLPTAEGTGKAGVAIYLRSNVLYARDMDPDWVDRGSEVAIWDPTDYDAGATISGPCGVTLQSGRLLVLASMFDPSNTASLSAPCDLRFIFSDDDGATWDTNEGHGYSFVRSTVNTYRSAIAQGADGTIHVAWRAGTTDTIQYARSTSRYTLDSEPTPLTVGVDVVGVGDATTIAGSMDADAPAVIGLDDGSAIVFSRRSNFDRVGYLWATHVAGRVDQSDSGNSPVWTVAPMNHVQLWRTGKPRSTTSSTSGRFGVVGGSRPGVVWGDDAFGDLFWTPIAIARS